MRLPRTGISKEEIRSQLANFKREDFDWRRGRTSAYVHFAGDDVLEVAKEAYLAFFSENGLGPRAFPSLLRMESDVIEMTLRLLNGGPESCGVMTTGGTESIFLAMKCARDRALAGKGSTRGVLTVIAPRSAHPAFDKAAHYLGMQVVRVPVDADFRADPIATAAAISEDTAMIVASAPAFPHGVVDPIEDFARLASERGVWLHVDACVGGFLIPFASELDAGIPGFDFSLEGVATISADIHKYGYGAKGASTLLFSDKENFKHLSFQFSNWQRGHYSTNTLVGTRAGGAIAAAWAVMNYLGHEGYLDRTRRILETRKRLEKGVEGLGFKIFGEPKLSILSYGRSDLRAPAIAAAMQQRGWMVGQTSEPEGLHIMLNIAHEGAVDEYLDALAQSIDDLPGEVGGLDSQKATY